MAITMDRTQRKKPINEAEEERQRQKKELHAVLGERDILTSQLVQRGAELEEIYEKIKIQRTRLYQGEQFYNKIVQQEENFHTTIDGLYSTYNSIQTDSSELPMLKRKVYLLESELFHEKSELLLLLFFVCVFGILIS